MKLDPVRLFLAVLLSVTTNFDCFAQREASRWTMGYDNGYPGFGGSDINFLSGNPDTSYVYRSVNFTRTSDNICDRNGNFLFCTNGYSVGDATNSFMLNGDSLYPYSFNDFLYGEDLVQGCIILPDPADSMKYFIFHELPELYVSFSNGAILAPANLYYSVVDMRLNNGLGAVSSKMNLLLADTLSQGQLTACRHANGRDWWLIVPECGNNSYYIYLLSPAGIQLVTKQNIGIRDYLSGQGVFSPDGSRYAYYNWYTGLEIFDFDRCSGTFSNAIYIPDIDTASHSGWGTAFSPDSKKIYVCSAYYMYQFNLDTSDIAASRHTVGIWDGYYDGVPLATAFYVMKLAIDGKIYVTTGNGTHYLHCIEYPDSLGAACHFQQRYLQLPTWYFNSIPNHPDFTLSAENGSVCDTVLFIPGMARVNSLHMQLFPNPISGAITIDYPLLDDPAMVSIFSFEGKKVANYSLPALSSSQHLDLAELIPGIYLARLESGVRSITKRFLVK